MKKLVYLLFLTSLPAIAQTLTVHAVYNVMRDGLRLGTVTDDFTVHNGHYEINSVTKADGLVALLMPKPITARSQGTLKKSGLHPLQFDQWRGEAPDKDIHTRFHWAKQQLDMTFNGKSIIAKLAPNAQDRLSLMYNYSVTPLPSGTFSIPMTTGKKIETYTLRNNGAETVQTSAGTWKAIHISRVTHPGNKGLDLWLAPSEHDLPVKIIIYDSHGGAFKQTLAQLKVTQ
ncbi:MAG: DUF3108 domain-containing protein [Proteobacteria bacterium]|nr:DUF3108 domain-containing protein [Pseudomonadota bacterium]